MGHRAKRGQPVTKSWTERTRRIQGVPTLVKVGKIGGREQVRTVGVVNPTDQGPVGHRRKT